MNGAKKTIFWLFRSFSLFSIFKILIYYLKKKMRILNYKNSFIIKFNFEGRKISFRIRENNDDFAIIREVFLYGAYRMQNNQEKKVEIIFDIGAHLGSSAVYLSCVFPSSKIYCFEPDLNSRKLLLENLGRNNVDASVFNLAVSNKKKMIYFNSDIKNPAFSEISNKNKGAKIKAVSIEDIFSFLDLDFVDIIKVDIEGEEIEMLKGLKKSSKRIGLFICETHYSKYRISDLKKEFSIKGFNIENPLPHWKFLNNEIEYPIMIAKNKFVKNEKWGY